MAVVIINVSEQHGMEYARGDQVYNLRMNSRVLCSFTHVYEDGLVSCLRKAADALEETERILNER